jgi:hypothetical protein
MTSKLFSAMGAGGQYITSFPGVERSTAERGRSFSYNKESFTIASDHAGDPIVLHLAWMPLKCSGITPGVNETCKGYAAS